MFVRIDAVVNCLCASDLLLKGMLLLLTWGSVDYE